MYANVKLYTVDYADYPAIQQDAFVVFNDDYYLYVVKEDSTVDKRLVKLGKNISGYYQILEGINPGERVVVAGMLTLSDGAKVKDISNPQENAPVSPEGFSMDKPPLDKMPPEMK